MHLKLRAPKKAEKNSESLLGTFLIAPPISDSCPKKQVIPTLKGIQDLSLE
jgi:hypothetical protein